MYKRKLKIYLPVSSRKRYVEVKTHLEYLPEGWWIEDTTDEKFCSPNIAQPKETTEYIQSSGGDTTVYFSHTY